MRVLKGLEPEKVFEYFEDICQIPHGSGNTRAISDYCVNFAKNHGLKFYRDGLNNVIIYKNATEGYENSPAVILQGHLDMVCEKDLGVDFDFTKDALKLVHEGDFVSASGTTLGGDDGIAVAMALAVLDDGTLSHPPLEVLFTTDEETGMYGAEGLDTSHLNGKILINIDSEDEGILTAGCAGGARAEITKKLSFETALPTVKITVSGLVGGHSGVEINKGRYNANMLLAELLCRLPEFSLADISGGAKDNVIPNAAECSINTDCDLEKIINDFIKEKFNENDPDLTVTVTQGEKLPVLSEEQSREIARFLASLPNGVQKMHGSIKDLVQTSLNLGVIKIENDALKVTFSVRSSVNDEKIELLSVLSNAAQNFGAAISDHGHYPAWEYRENSPLRNTMVNTFERLYGRRPIVDVIHAGLECGLFCEKIEGLDALSIGPDLFEIHTPRERLSVSSTKRTYEFLCKTLENMK